MTTDELETWWKEKGADTARYIRALHYLPKPVRSVDIPKLNGGTRKLGIPCVVDRMIQQAALQATQPILDPTFSECSFGFRPGRSALEYWLKKCVDWRSAVYRPIRTAL